MPASCRAITANAVRKSRLRFFMARYSIRNRALAKVRGLTLEAISQIGLERARLQAVPFQTIFLRSVVVLSACDGNLYAQHDHKTGSNACRRHTCGERAASARIAGCVPRLDNRRHDPRQQSPDRQPLLLAAGSRPRTGARPPRGLGSGEMVGGRDAADD